MGGGVLVIDKPRGPTSHDVVARLRRVLRTRQVGHCGTLDPMATGVLVVAIDEATKLVPWLTADDKAYEATIRLGVETDSLDADGAEIRRASVPEAVLAELREGSPPNSGAIARAVAQERARISQVPPAVSAVKIGGERAHVLARRGEAPELPPREVAVRRLAIAGGGVDPDPHLRVALDVTKGYFVRSLARDLATALGTAGHLTALRRTRSGVFTIDEAVALDGADRDSLDAAMVPLARAASRALPVSVLTDEGARAAFHGKIVSAEAIRDPHPTPSAWLDAAGRLVAVGEVDAAGGRVLRGFPP
ncbi:MAG: tRNA pseudouridine(55) synthase TruB [Labilithrix sp.]|nr:tRNA pseudouridine(55) synthase TruB [Labilithrix sp.]